MVSGNAVPVVGDGVERLKRRGRSRLRYRSATWARFEASGGALAVMVGDPATVSP